MAASSIPISLVLIPAISGDRVELANSKKMSACQKLEELFGLTVPATEQACFEAAWEKCVARDWKLLKQCQEELNHIVNEQGRSLLQQAIRIGKIGLATEMIANGIAIHARDSMGNTAMHYAVQTESLKLVLQLYEHINQDARNDQEQTPLHYAAARGQLDIIRTLIAKGANLGASTQVPIHDLNANASLSIGDLTLPNLTPLAFAAIRGDRDCVDLFLSENKMNPALNLNLRFGTIGNLLHLLITFHHTHLLKFVLTKHYEQISPLLNERNHRDGLPPFMLAAYLGEEETLVLLKDHNVNLEATDSFGRTAVHHAVLGRQKKSLVYLQRFGVNLMAPDEKGNIPRNLLKGHKDSESKSIRGLLSNLSKQKAKAQHALPNFVIDPPENLIFKGDDPTGLAYLGAIKALEMKDKISSIKRVAGASTAALIATLFASGYSFEEMASKAKFFSNFFDSPMADQSISSIPKSTPQVVTLQRLRDIIQEDSSLGKDEFNKLHQLPSLCSGKALLDWIEERIYEKTGIHDCTFGELQELAKTNPQFKQLTVFTTCFGNTLTPSRFSSEDKASDDIVISHAVCAALSVPGIFPPKSLYFKNKAGGVDESLSLGLHGDAALINNFSIEAYDREKYQSVMPLTEEAGEYFRLNKRTLGFALEPRARNHSISETVTVQQLLEQVLTIYCQIDPSMQQSTLYNCFRVVQIQNESLGGISSFPLEERMEKIIAIGEESTAGFFEEQERAASSLNPLLYMPERTNRGGKWTNLKSPLPYFVGRTQQINILKERLLPEDVNPTTTSSSGASSSSGSSSTSLPPLQRRSCVVLAGAGGMGKSETAIAFAHQYRGSFSVIWWIETATPQSMDRSFRKLAEALDIYIELTSSAETTRERIYLFLGTENLGKPYLLIFDNAEESIELPHDDHGRILITTTQPSHFLMEDILPIEPFTEDESINVVARILKQEGDEEMKRLAVELEYLPAILSQAAQYIRTTPGMTLHKYLELLSKEKVKVLTMMPIDSRYTKAQLSTWRMAHETLMQNYPVAYEWLEMCAYLQPDGIPSSYLESWLECFKDEQSYVERMIKKDQILRTLVNAGILRYDQKSDSYSLHRIRQEMIKQILVESERAFTQSSSSSSSSSSPSFVPGSSSSSSRQKVIALLTTTVNQLDLEAVDDWLVIAPHEGQIRAILEIINDERDDSVEIASMNHFLGRWLLVQGNDESAIQFLTKALAIRRKLLPVDHSDTARTLGCLGMIPERTCVMHLGKSSIQYTIEAYKMRKRLYQGDHPEIAESLLNIYGSYEYFSAVEDEGESEKNKYLNRALEMLQRLYPNGHRSVAMKLVIDANRLKVANRFHEAYGCAIQALEMLKRIYSGDYSRNHSDMALVFILSAGIAKKLGKNDEALIYYKETLIHNKKAIDRYVRKRSDRPVPTGYLSNISDCYWGISEIMRAQGNVAEVWKYYEKIVKASVKNSDSQMISKIIRAQGNGVGTWGDCEKIVNMIEKINPTSELLVECFNEMGQLRLQSSDLAEPIAFFTQYINSNTVYGNEQSISTALFHLGRMHYKLGSFELARTQLMRSQEIKGFLISPKLSAYLSFVEGCLYQKRRNHQEAVTHFRIGISTFKKMSRKMAGNTDVAEWVVIPENLRRLGNSLKAISRHRHQEAQDCFNEADAIERVIAQGASLQQILGVIALELVRKAKILLRDNRSYEAREYAKKALKMCLGDYLEKARVLELLADIAMKEEKNDEALVHCGRIAEILVNIPPDDAVSYLSEMISKIMNPQGDDVAAWTYYKNIMSDFVYRCPTHRAVEDCLKIISKILHAQGHDAGAWSNYEKIVNLLVIITPTHPLIEECFHKIGNIRFLTADLTAPLALLTQFIDSPLRGLRYVNLDRDFFAFRSGYVEPGYYDRNTATALFILGITTYKTCNYELAKEQLWQSSLRFPLEDSDRILFSKKRSAFSSCIDGCRYQDNGDHQAAVTEFRWGIEQFSGTVTRQYESTEIIEYFRRLEISLKALNRLQEAQECVEEAATFKREAALRGFQQPSTSSDQSSVSHPQQVHAPPPEKADCMIL